MNRIEDLITALQKKEEEKKKKKKKKKIRIPSYGFWLSSEQ